MTAIEKQIQAAQKRITTFERNVDMYRSRADRQMEKLQSAGYMVTREDFDIRKSGRWKYDYDYNVSDRVKESVAFTAWQPVVTNLLMEREKQDRLDNERKHLQELKDKVEQNIRLDVEQTVADKPLKDKLAAVLEPFRTQWTENMIQWHTRFYDRIHDMLPNARIQYKELKSEIDRLYRENGFRPTPKIKQLERARQSFGRILSAPPAAYPDKEKYLDYIRPRLKEEFDGCVSLLAEKCRKFALDADKVQAHHPRMSERGLDVLLSDGKNRVVDVRMIWAAEYSQVVTPHTRYIVTERNGVAIQNRTDNNETVKTDREIKDRITDVSVYHGRGDSLFIRCKVDGQQQQAKELNIWDTQTYNEKTDLTVLAARYYHEELHAEEEISRGIKR